MLEIASSEHCWQQDLVEPVMCMRPASLDQVSSVLWRLLTCMHLDLVCWLILLRFLLGSVQQYPWWWIHAVSVLADVCVLQLHG